MLRPLVCSILLAAAFGSSLERRQILLNCRKRCPTTQDPVCGSDHHTYASSCTFEIAMCYARQKGVSLHLAHRGACGGGATDPAANTDDCDAICDEEIKHVCGSDGVVYQNPCLFKRAACEAAQNGTQLKALAFTDTCPTPRMADCQQYEVDTSGLAVEGGATLSVQCPHDRHHVAPVCDSAGHTHYSECELCSSMKDNSQPDLMIEYDGVCKFVHI